MIVGIALFIMSFGLLMDIVNLYWYFKSIKTESPSPIVLTPLIPYLIGVLLIKYQGISWMTFAIFFLILFFIHIFSIFLLPILVMAILKYYAWKKHI